MYPRVISRLEDMETGSIYVEERLGSVENMTETLEEAVDLQSISGSTTLDLTAGRVFSATVTGNVTINMSEPVFGASILLILSNGGNYSVTWGMAPQWAGGAAPELTGKDLIALNCGPDGLWYGVHVASEVA